MIYIIQYISYIYYNKILNSQWIGVHARVDSLSLSLSPSLRPTSDAYISIYLCHIIIYLCHIIIYLCHIITVDRPTSDAYISIIDVT